MSKKENRIFRNPEGMPLEDRALKEAAGLFGEELLPLLGVREKMLRIAPTEQVYLNPKDFIEDFNYEMEDGSWKHLEFESDGIQIKDLRRFRTYEAITSQNNEVDVTTCVICTAGNKTIRDRLVTGINTYRVKVIRMKDKNADQVIEHLVQRQKDGPLDRADLLMALLTPLMDGTLSQEDRIRKSFQLLKGERENRRREELARMEAVLYTFAMKFLKKSQLKRLKEAMNMTILGEMIMQEGIEKGRKEGREEGKEYINRLNMILIGQNRFEDVKRASQDREYQQKLIRELFPEEKR